jgi:hypothetical protein
MNAAIHNVEAPFPQAFASRPPKKARSLFPGAPGYSRNRVPSVGRDRRPLGVHAPSAEALRWSFPCFLANTVVFLPQVLHLGTHTLFS